MTPVEQALWYVEAHIDTELTLDEIAANAGVSKYHLLRAFSAASGLTLMRYVRGRRLTHAASRLAAGATDILTVALEAGYASHEAFTRAFREQFATTPESVRAQRHTNNLDLVPPLSIQTAIVDNLVPRFENSETILVAGLIKRYEGSGAGVGVPAQWRQFAGHSDRIAERLSSDSYGVCYNTDDEGGMDYLCGAIVRTFSGLPAELSRLRIPAQRYVVFAHRDHMAAIRATWHYVWNGWLPNSGHEPADAPLFERYQANFNHAAGVGEVELWVPLKR